MDQQLLELLRSHAHPPPHLNLAATMSTVAAGLAQYDTELARLRAQFKSVKARRAALQDHYDKYTILNAPIRRLPPEILVKIFDLCRHFGDQFLPSFRRQRTTHPLEQAHLVILAQVCRRWRSVALDTHTLWDAIELTERPGREQGDKLIRLLAVALRRGGNSMINITVSGSPPPQALQLLARHSERWLAFRFACDSSNLQYLSAAKGRFPLLQIVELDSRRTLRTWRTQNLFKVAPKLRSLTIDGRSLPSPGEILVEQLHSLTFHRLGFTHLVPAISLMSRLSRNTKCILGCDLGHWDEDESRDSDSEPTTSDIIALSLEFDGGVSSVGVQRALQDVPATLLACFTFPGLHELSVGTKYNSQKPLPWPSDHFLALCERSSFDTHLTSLQLHRVLVTEEELLQSLDALPSLERLAISDHRRHHEDSYDSHGEYVYDDGSASCDLITDTLLVELMRAPDSPCIVPRLRVCDIRSFLKFDDDVYLAFLQSRVAGETRFESHIRWLGDYGRALDWKVVREIDELCRRKELVFSFEKLKG